MTNISVLQFANMKTTDQILKEYNNLFAIGHHSDAIGLSKSLLTQLFKENEFGEIKRIVQNIIDTTHDSDKLSFALVTLGDVLYAENLYDRARASYLHGLNFEINASPMKSRILGGVANTFFMEGDYLSAKDYYLESLNTARTVNYILGIGESLLQLSEVSRVIGEYKDAEKFLLEALKINTREKREDAVRRCVQNLANLVIHLTATNDKDSAIALVNEAINLLTDWPNIYKTQLLELLNSLSA